MNKWLATPDETKRRAYTQIAENTGMSPFAVEKDWWVVQTLSAISETEAGPYLIFKGGTSLSKAWKLIQRFSEDIDLAIDREFLGFEGNLSKNQRTKLRKKAGRYVEESFFPELATKFEEKGLVGARLEIQEEPESDRDRKIDIFYPYVVEAPGYILPRVQLEMGCRSLKEPFSVQRFSTMLAEHYPDANFSEAAIPFPTANPERTFLEKIFLLHEEFQRPKEKMRVDRLSRHLYDVVKLSRTNLVENVFDNPELWETMVQHRYSYTRVSGVNYNLHQPQSINPIPVPEVMSAWKSDYKKMIEQMIYEEAPPTFDEMLSELLALKAKINAISWNLNAEFPYSPVPKA